MKKIFSLFAFLYLSIIAVSAQTIGEIRFEGLKRTNQNYLLKMSGISVGGNWNESIKASVISKLTALNKIIEKVEITESVNDSNDESSVVKIAESDNENNMITVTITVYEKFSFIIIPFLTYSNKAGIKPRIIFRNYNLGGYGKYFGAKAAFSGDDSLDFSVEYKDYQFLNRDDMTLSVDAIFETSAPNYIVTDYAPDLKPIGSTSWDEERWNDENVTEFNLYGLYGYRLPWRNAQFYANARFIYQYIHEWDDKSDDYHYEVPIHKFIPSTAASLSIPIAEHFEITPWVSFGYRLEHNEEKGVLINGKSQYTMLGRYSMFYTPYFNTKFSVPFKEIGLTYSVQPAFQLYIGDHRMKTSRDFLDFGLRDLFNECALNFSLNNSISRSGTLAKGLTYNVGLSNTISQRFFHYKTAYSSGSVKNDTLIYYIDKENPWRSVENTIQIQTHFTYKMDYNFYKRHLFALKFRLFYYYNGVNTKDDYKGIDEKIYSPVWRAVWEQDTDYEMFENVGDFTGYAGGMLNLGYRLPLFTFKTPNFLGITMKKELIWDANLLFFIDMGLAQNYGEIMRDSDYKDYIINRDLLHLCPGLGTGIKLEVAPRFIPIKATVSLGVDVYKMLKTKNFNSNLVFTIGIDNQ
ncbi:MAG: hypothetical protein J1G30_03360 [Spirochaetales bacterium]|nr:hypothetical protein [Spirochaetales bacterium]